MTERLFIGINNTQESVPSTFFWTFINIRNPYPTSAFRSEHAWDVVRNNHIIHYFLQSDCTILIKMDIDQAYPPDYFERFVPLVSKYKVIGPLIYDRLPQNNFMPLAFERINYPVSMTPMDLSNLSGIVEIPYAHTNLFYHREVIEKLSPPWYEAYQRQDGSGRANHVDFDFISKIHKAGYKIHIDLDCVVGHQYTSYVGRRFHEKWNSKS